MPSSRRIAAVLVLIGMIGLAYSVLTSQVIIGAWLTLSAFVVAALVYYGDAKRHTLTRAAIVVTVVYGVFLRQLPMAVIAACVVYLSAWLTGPNSPLNAPDTEIFPARRVTTEESEYTD